MEVTYVFSLVYLYPVILPSHKTDVHPNIGTESGPCSTKLSAPSAGLAPAAAERVGNELQERDGQVGPAFSVFQRAFCGSDGAVAAD